MRTTRYDFHFGNNGREEKLHARTERFGARTQNWCIALAPEMLFFFLVLYISLGPKNKILQVYLAVVMRAPYARPLKFSTGRVGTQNQLCFTNLRGKGATIGKKGVNLIIELEPYSSRGVSLSPSLLHSLSLSLLACFLTSRLVTRGLALLVPFA